MECLNQITEGFPFTLFRFSYINTQCIMSFRCTVQLLIVAQDAQCSLRHMVTQLVYFLAGKMLPLEPRAEVLWKTRPPEAE